MREIQWQRREIENYLAFPNVLRRYAQSSAHEDVSGPLFAEAEAEKRLEMMEASIQDLVPPIALRNPDDPYWSTVKASDELLDRVFAEFYQRLQRPNLMHKTAYHRLAGLVQADELDNEVVAVLDSINEIAQQAQPVGA